MAAPLYKAISRSHLDYCIQKWKQRRRKSTDICFKKRQRKATELIPWLILGMWSNNTGDVKIEGGQIEVVKVLNDHVGIDPNTCFQNLTGKITRGHDFTLVKEQSRLHVLFLPEDRT